jgi:hypothetical protein
MKQDISFGWPEFIIFVMISAALIHISVTLQHIDKVMESQNPVTIDAGTKWLTLSFRPDIKGEQWTPIND